MIRPFKDGDQHEFYTMAHTFHFSDAVGHDTPSEHFAKTFANSQSARPWVDGYIIEQDGKVAGYGLVHYTFSNEAGGMLYTWDELYIKPEFRGHGLGSSYIAFCEQRYVDKAAMFRLEVEYEHDKLFNLYGKLGYRKIGYLQLTKFRDDTTLAPYDQSVARPFTASDRELFLRLEGEYHAYNTIELSERPQDAAHTFDTVLSGSQFVDGFILEQGKQPVGYCLVSILYANEAGGLIANLDELYISPEYRGRGTGRAFIDYYENYYYDRVSFYRLEIAANDQKRIDYFKPLGYEWLEYLQMLKRPGEKELNLK